MGLFSELKNRKVFTTAVIYVPSAWLATEIFLVLFDRFGLPSWTGDVVVALFILGFPATLLLSWLFDITEDGIQRASPGTPVGLAALIGVGLFLGIGAYVTYQVFSGRFTEIRVAVLPLQSTADQPSVQPYGSGIADSLRTSLQGLPSFSVAARTSSEAVVTRGFAISEITETLQVDYVVEGTLRQIDDILNVSLSVIDSDGEVLRTQKYDSKIDDIFSLQNELVRALATGFGVSDTDPALIASLREPPPTRNPEAHRLYLQGMYGTFQEQEIVNEDYSLNKLLEAMRLDPGYAAIYAALAMQYAMECWGGDDRNDPRCELAISTAKRGLELDPGLSDAYTTLALAYAVQYRYFEAQEALDRFYADPNHKIGLAAVPWAYFNLGRMQDAWNTTEEFYQNDPLHPAALISIALYSHVLKGDPELVRYYDRLEYELLDQSFLASEPSARAAWVDRSQAVEELRVILPLYEITSPEVAEIFVAAAYDEPDLRRAVQRLDEIQASGELRDAWYWGALLQLSETDRVIEMAFEQFDQGVLNPPLLWARGPGTQEAQQHPRFIELMKYIGIADYWDVYGWPGICEPVGESYRCGVDWSAE